MHCYLARGSVGLPVCLRQASATLAVAALGSEVERGQCLLGPGLREWDGFQWQHGVDRVWAWAQECSKCIRNLRVQVLSSALLIHNTCPQQARTPRSLQWIYLMTVLIWSSFLISPNLKYMISTGSSISIQNTELGGFPNSEALPFVCINLILLYCWKSLEHFAKLKALLHLWMRFCISCRLALLCVSWRGACCL